MTRIRKKLIEVALPLDAINAASAREKSIRHGHPSTLHLWWARRPLAAARAVIFAQMVDDPSAVPELFPSEAEQNKERERLFHIIEELVEWENTTNEAVLQKAREEIRQSWRRACADNAEHPRAKELFDPNKLPAFHDPFAGGGTLPLEAQRLGLEAYASDLNPVAVLINKAMIEIPPKFAGRAPVGPIPAGERQGKLHEEWRGAQGLAEDVRRYGRWMREQAEKRIGHLYPKIAITAEMAKERPDLKPYVGRELTVIAWLWARTVKSPNPAFAHVDVPLTSTFMLCTKPGKEAYVEPVIENGGYRFTVKIGKPKNPEAAKNGTKLARGSFQCLMSGSPITGDYIKSEGMAERLGARLMAIVAEGDRGRIYLSPTPEHEAAARAARPEWKPEGEIAKRMTGGNCTPYGLTTFGDLFTNRQLVALTTFSDLVAEARAKVLADALGARASRPHSPLTPKAEWHSRRGLPHWEAGETPQSITFRLADSLPREVIERLAQARAAASQAGETPALQRERFESLLDSGHGECLLARPELAEIVENALLHFDGTRYRLHAWCIMPNHVHVLATPLHGFSLSSIVHSWKSFTAKAINAALGRSGPVWFEEYFDRAIRNAEHFAAAQAYIEANPVKAGLCAAPEDWPFSSAARGAQGPLARVQAGRPRSADEIPLREGGTGAQAYADAVAVYLAFAVDKSSGYWSGINSWDSSRETVRSTFSRQALPMVWDYAEANPLCDSSGNWMAMVDWTWKALETTPARSVGIAAQADAQNQSFSLGKLISTDPPYYDNIGYADLSDFFYVWLRRSLRPIFPDLFATLAVPKAEELVATPYRHGGKEEAEKFFLEGMTKAMHRLAEQAHPAFPVTIYYAFKQSETDAQNGTASTGWETFLDAVIRAGFGISGTWPMRTELSNRIIGSGANVLASSIVLVCRPRDAAAKTATRRDFVAALKKELPQALRRLQAGNIAPVDLAQAAIGPGMAIYTRYAQVLNAEGKPVSVGEALALINATLDEALAEQEGDFDAESRWALAWFEQNGFDEGEFGIAETLSKAKNVSVAGLDEAGILVSRRGKVRLLKPGELSETWNPQTATRLTVWESVHHLIRVLESGGESKAADLVAKLGAHAHTARELAYRLYTICERKKRAAEALAYNGLVQSWPEIVRLAQGGSEQATQPDLFVAEER